MFGGTHGGGEMFVGKVRKVALAPYVRMHSGGREW